MDRRLLRRGAAANRAIVIFLMLALIGCTGIGRSSSDANGNRTANSNDKTMGEPTLTLTGKVDPRLVSANTRFGFKLYAEMLKEDAGKNLFISPASVGLCLAMAYNGAAGETRQAMASALEASEFKLDDFNRAYAELKAALASADPKVQLDIANSLWARKGLDFKQDFINRNKQFFGAEVSALDFDDPSSVATINSWVSNKTKGKIEKIVDQISNDTILFLINAIYFKGKWSRQFDKAQTREDAFTTAAGAQKRVPMMSQSGRFMYLESPGFQAVSLPYGDGRVSMYVFLPAKGSGLDQFHKGLSVASWEEWVGKFEEMEGSLRLPRFKVEYEAALNDALKALGMGVAFDQTRADFSGMVENTGRVFISQVKHKTFAEVNEEGTEAAAVTSTEMRATSARQPSKTFQMIVDRPFFCAIRDNTTGTVLFMGSIIDPQ
jgi:serine protease inhibitor